MAIRKLTEQRFDDNLEIRYEIVADDLIVGMAVMTVYEDGDRHLERIDIDEGHRGQGHGTAALLAIRDEVGTYFIVPDNERAADLYARLGEEMNTDDYDRFGFALDDGFGVYEI